MIIFSLLIAFRFLFSFMILDKAIEMNELDRFETFLRGRGQKITKPRRIILEAFLNTEGHLSTEDILHEAKNAIQA